ncbi:MAG: phenylalanine--tRNA ligase subunit beta [Patescibacteria group bacterium]
MLLVKDWLSEFVSFPKNVSDEEIVRRLNMSTVEVEGIHRIPAQNVDHMIIGEIRALEPHPNADRLRVATVACGKGAPRNIVCGGSNLAVGMKVAVALPGAQVRWHGEGELVTLEKTAIRGVLSDGMICASTEIGLGEWYPASSEHEILDCSFVDAPAGTPLEKAIPAHTIFEIDNKSLSHRPDLWGHRGVARELSALFASPFHDKQLPALPEGHGHTLKVSVEVPDLCSRYIGLVVDGVSTKPSPSWMQERLRAAGIRPISAIVDITNYVMLEYGQPMHAFDYTRIAGTKGAHIIVRKASEGETIRCLDGRAYALSSDMLVIANDTAPLAIAGVMGGEDTGVGPETTTCVFEAAHFAPLSVRRTANRLGLVSESSRRFEKDIDPELSAHAMARALQLTAQLFPQSRVSSALCDVYRKASAQKSIVIEHDMLERRLGESIAFSRAATLLKRLGFGVAARKRALTVEVPSFRRKDIAIPEDVIEEVLRIIGYDAISSSMPRVPARVPTRDMLRTTIRRVTRMLSLQFAFREVLSYCFVRPETIRTCGLSTDDHIELANPLSQERPFLCRSLIPNLLETLEKSQQQEKRQCFFEINRVFFKNQSASIPDQPIMLGFVFSARGETQPFSYCADFVRTLCSSLGWSVRLEEAAREPYFSRQCSARIVVGDQDIGALGLISVSTREQMGIDTDVVAGEINLTALSGQPVIHMRYQGESSFPAVARDVTFVVDDALPYRKIEEALSGVHPLIERALPFAIYRDKKIGEGKKSVSFHITYRAPDRTLTGEEVDAAHAAIIALTFS